MRITVLGGGIIGLLSAHALAHEDHTVRMLARELGSETTSARAAASFKPSGLPRSALHRPLLIASRDQLDRWSASGFASRLGIATTIHLEASDQPLERDYLDVMREVRHLSSAAGDRIPGGYRHAVSYRTYVFDTPLTLRALTDHLHTDHGIHPERAVVSDLRQLTRDPDTEVVVNASGLGARHLADDAELLASRGQTVRVAALPEPLPWSVSAGGSYLYPRADGLLLGGTTDLGVWDEHPDPLATRRILAGATRLVPELGDATPIEVRVGLRPWRRSGVRLEVARDHRVPVVHAYGHGGSGWTLGPGTARWVAEAVRSLATDGAIGGD